MNLPVQMALAACVLAGGLSACGGSSRPTPTPTPPANQDPCATASLEEDAGIEQSPISAPAREVKRQATDGNPRWRVLDALWAHRAAGTDAAEPGRESLSPSRTTADIGEIAVLQDEGDLIVPANALDLRSLGLRFTRNASGGYDITRIDGTFRSALGSRLTLTDDDSVPATVPFSFALYGKGQNAAFVNSDGNVTFEEEDRSSSERNISRLLTGPPRVSPFLTDLDPTMGTGRIFLNAATDQFTVTWCNVRGFDSASTVSVQATLLPSGAIEMKYGATVAVASAVVGLSPGRTTVFNPVNLSEAGPTAGGSGAVGERFAGQPDLDTVAVARKFYRTHPDNYDQLVIWSDATLIQDSFAYESTLANEIQGIGQDVYDLSREFGSAGKLRSLAVMDWLGKYPDDPTQKFLGENNTLSVMGQEVGHRWLAFIDIRDRTGARSDVLLGRDLAHWSFFFDSDASVMEGNDIEDLGGGSFRTVSAVQRYSLLDQYVMGLVPDSSVPPFFYVEGPTNLSTPRTRDSAPLVGVTFVGTKREMLIQDVIAANGVRVPSAAQSSRLHRQAFLYIVGAGRTADGGQVEKLDRIRRQWEPFFLQATDNRMRADTRLQNP
jgi:hypothetical protein